MEPGVLETENYRINDFQNKIENLKNEVGMTHQKMVKSVQRSLSNSFKMAETAVLEDPFEVLYDMTNGELEILDDHMDK